MESMRARLARSAALPLLLPLLLSAQPSVEIVELGQGPRLVHGGDMVLGRLDGLVHDPTRFPAVPWPRHPDHPSRARLLWEPPNEAAIAAGRLTDTMVTQVNEALQHWQQQVNGAQVRPYTRLTAELYAPQEHVFFTLLRQRVEKVAAPVAPGEEAAELQLPNLSQAVAAVDDLDGHCTGSYAQVWHERLHDPEIVPLWGRRYRGTPLPNHEATSLRSTGPEHGELQVQVLCRERLPRNNYMRPTLVSDDIDDVLEAETGAATERPEGVLRLYRGNLCAATVGWRPDFNAIWLRYSDEESEGCDERATRHEIGHVLGFHHEHQRADRDAWVEVLWDRLPAGLHSQYEAGHLGLRPYAFESIMHYGADAGLRSIPPGIPMGGREAAPADVAAFDELYGFPWRGLLVSTHPVAVDLDYGGAPLATPATLFPTPGTTRRLAWDVSTPPQAVRLAAEDEREQASLDRTYGVLTKGSRALFARWSNGEIRPRLQAPLLRSQRWIGASARVEHQVLARSALEALGGTTVSPAEVGGWFLETTEVRVRADGRHPDYRFRDWSDSWRDARDLAWFWSLEVQRPGHNPASWTVERPLALTAEWIRRDWRWIHIGARRELQSTRLNPLDEPSTEATFSFELATSRAQFPWTSLRGPVTLTDVNGEWEYLGLRWTGGTNAEEEGRRLVFRRWSDGSTALERPVEVPASGGISIDAVHREECRLTVDIGGINAGGFVTTNPLVLGNVLRETTVLIEWRWEGPEAVRYGVRIGFPPEETVWVPCGSEVTLEALPRGTGVAFSHWRGAFESARPRLQMPMDGPRRVAAIFRDEDSPAGERERQLLLQLERVFPVYPVPSSLAFSGVPGPRHSIPPRLLRFHARGDPVAVDCGIEPPAGGSPLPTGKVVLDPPSFSAAARGTAMRVQVDSRGLPVGDHSFWLTCRAAGSGDPLRIPVSWTLTLPEEGEGDGPGFRIP